MSAVPVRLESGLSGLGLDFSEDLRARLQAYVDLIIKWNRVYNLTAIRDADKVLTHHLLDSLAVLPHLQGGRVADVGSGAGLPGIPLALVRPDWKVTLIESSHKKSTFLHQALIELGISNASVASDRVEALSSAAAFDVVISRAFSDLPEFIKLAGHLVAQGGVLAAMKGLYPHEELALVPTNWRVDRVVPLQVPGLGAARHLVLVRSA